LFPNIDDKNGKDENKLLVILVEMNILFCFFRFKIGLNENTIKFFST